MKRDNLGKNMDKIQSLLGTTDITVSEAMQKIDMNSLGILFLVDAHNKLVGCITDGDIRRFLLAGRKMTELAVEAANKSPKVAKTRKQAAMFYHKRDYIVVPIVSDSGEVVDLYTGDAEIIRKDYKPVGIPVVINAGGRGSRLNPFTKVLPKPLIPVGDSPIIELIMKEYQAYDCNDFHIIVNYKKDLLKAYFSDGENKYNITWYDENEPLGTGGGLTLLRGKMNSTFFFANCDALLTADYEEILDFHKKNGNVITMICALKNVNIPYGVVDMGPNGVIESMNEKPLLSFLTNTGMYIVEPEVFDEMEDGVSIDFPDVIEKLRKKGIKVAVFPISENNWMDMGQVQELEKMRIKLCGE